jgi:hypothetical protein
MPFIRRVHPPPCRHQTLSGNVCGQPAGYVVEGEDKKVTGPYCLVHARYVMKQQRLVEARNASP